MAVHTRTYVVDDLDGTEGASAQTFSLNGVDYAIDLGESNAAALEAALAPYIARATRVGGRRQRASGGRADLADIRRWAHEQGIEVSDRGRIPVSVIEQYDAAVS